jgi:hypothetical protein
MSVSPKRTSRSTGKAPRSLWVDSPSSLPSIAVVGRSTLRGPVAVICWMTGERQISEQSGLLPRKPSPAALRSRRHSAGQIERQQPV